MKCTHCGREVALARVCPYCWTKLPSPPEQDEQGREEGEFVGPISSGKEPSKLLALVRYLLDPNVPWTKKLFVIGAVIYILNPWDLIPFYIPLLGWLDDLVLLGFLIRFLRRELDGEA
ncbi:MAG: YkvA family protein [Limnochordia bacterium]|jgi:hypothetical protein